MIATFPSPAIACLDSVGTLRWAMVVLLLGLGTVGVSQEAPKSDNGDKEAQPSEADELALLQAQLADNTGVWKSSCSSAPTSNQR